MRIVKSFRPHSLLALLVASLVVVPPASAQETVRVGFKVPVERPLLVDIKRVLDGTMKVEVLDEEREFPVSHESELVFVDEYSVLEKKKEVARRHFVKDQSKTNRETSDGICNQLIADYSSDGDDVEVVLGGHRVARDRELAWLLEGFASLGIWVDLPEKMELRETAKVDFSPLSSLLGFVGTEGKKTKGKLELISYDVETAIAKLTGDVTLEFEDWVYGTKIDVEIIAKCALEVSSVERRITSLTLHGKYNFEGDDDLRIESSGDYSFDLTTTIGNRATDARKKKYRHRKRTYRVPQLGIQLKLPSHWSRLYSSGDAVTFVRTLDSDKGEVYVDASFIEFSSDNPNWYFDKLEGALREDYPDLVVRNVKSPIAKGKIFYIKEEGRDADLFQSEVYPWKGKFLLLKLYGTPRAYGKALKEFERIRASLRPVTY